MSNQAVASPLTIEIERKGDAALVKCHGRLIAGLAEDLHAKVKPLLAEIKEVVVDLGDVSFMDSIGLGILVRLYVSAKSAECHLELMNVGKRIREVLKITHLLEVFPIAGESGGHPRH
jgi:anti-sigma B factor antagonist